MDHTRPGSSRGSSVESTQMTYAHVAELFEYFIYAITMKHILALYREMCNALNLRPNRLPEFYPILKSKLGRNWRADGIFKKLDAKIANNIYGKNLICQNTRVLVIGAGPCGLRAAIECQLLGAKVVVIEKRDRMSRHNVLHLWPFVVEDLISLGAKKYFPKFCSGPIDHISIRQLQYMLLKVALLIGVEFFEGVSFEELLEPTISEDGESKGWRACVSPADHPVSQYEFDVLIGADGKRNTLKGFRRSEFRGKLAIGITVNFIHHRTQLEASVPELSGRSYHFHQDYFNELTKKTGIELENIVYYKGDTHYFVMTAKKSSLLRRKVLKEDFAEVSKLLSVENVDNKALLDFARDAARYAVNYKLPLNDFALNHYLQPDCAMFDFTTFYAAENACVVFEVMGYSLLCQLVGDSLLEPFWPTGSGCARGFLSALDSAWQIRSWGIVNNPTHPIDLIAERESLYKFLPYTDPNNMCVRTNKYTIDPTTRYLTKDRKEMPLARCQTLYQSDDPAPMDAPRASKRPTNLQASEKILLQWAGEEHYQELNMDSMPAILVRVLRRYRPDLLPRSPTYANAVSVLTTKFNIAPLSANADKAAVRKYLCKVYNIFKGEVPYVPVHVDKDILQQLRSRPTSTPKYSVQTSVVSKTSDKDRKSKRRRNKFSVSKLQYSDQIRKKIGKLKVEDISKLARLIDGHDTLQDREEDKEKRMAIQDEIVSLLQQDTTSDEKLTKAQIVEMLQGSKNVQNQPHRAIAQYFRGKKELGKKSQRKLKGLVPALPPRYFGEHSNGESYVDPREHGEYEYESTYMKDYELNETTPYYEKLATDKGYLETRESESPDPPVVQRRSNSIAAPEMALSDIASRYDAKGNPDKNWRRRRIAEIVAGHEAKISIDPEAESRSKRSNSIGPDMALKMRRVADLIDSRRGRGSQTGCRRSPSSLALHMQRVSDIVQDSSTDEVGYPRRRVYQGMARDRFERCMEMLCSGPSPLAPSSADLDNDYGLQQYRASAPHFDERVRLLERQLRQFDDLSVESSPKKKLYSKGRVMKLAAELADQKEPAKTGKQKPKDLLRAIGKIEPSDWHLRQIEKKIRDNQLGRPAPKKAERVPQWDRVQFLERQQRLKEVDGTPPSTSTLSEVKYKDLPDQGTNKVASLADRFKQSFDLPEHTPERQNLTGERVKAWIGPRVQNVECVVCKKVVFHAESANADGVHLHKNCFRCIICNTNLRPGNFRVQRCIESPTGPVKIYCLKHSSEPNRVPPPRVPAPSRPAAARSTLRERDEPDPASGDRLSWTGLASSTTPPRECDEDEWTDLNNLASDIFLPNSDEEEDEETSSSAYEDAVSSDERARRAASLYAPQGVLLLRPRHDPTDSTAGYDDLSDDGGSSSGASCSRMREALEARRREVPPAFQILATSDSSEEVESEDDEEPSDEESSATEVSTDSEFGREEAPHPPAITVTEAPPLSLPPLVPDYTPAPRPAPPLEYPLSRTRSTGGIATKRALELKKRYLLGEPTAGAVKKSDSTSQLDVKLQMVQSSISEFQKLLNPAPVTPSFVPVNFPSPIEYRPPPTMLSNDVALERPKESVSDDTPSKVSSSEDTVKEVIDAHDKDALEASKEELETDTLSEEDSSTIGKASQSVPRLEVHDATGELVHVNKEVAAEPKSEEEGQSGALSETELSDWAADSAVDDCVPASILEEHTRTPNKSPRSLAGPKPVYGSEAAPLHVCGKDSDVRAIAFSDAFEHFQFADEGEPDLGIAAAVNRGFMELVLDNRTTDNDRSMEFIEKCLTDPYIPANDIDRREPVVGRDSPTVVGSAPMKTASSETLDAEGNYRRKEPPAIENNNEQSLCFNGTNKSLSADHENDLTPTKELEPPMHLGAEPPSPMRHSPASVDIKVQEMKRKKDEETEIVRQLVLGKHGNMNRRNAKRSRAAEWGWAPPVPPLPCELPLPPSPPPPPPPPPPAASVSDPDLTKKSNFLKTLLHLPQRIYLRTKDSSWSSSSTHKSTGALSPPPVPSPPLNYRPRAHGPHSKPNDFRPSGSAAASASDHTAKSTISSSTSGLRSTALVMDVARVQNQFPLESATYDRRLEHIEKKLSKPHKLTVDEYTAAVAMRMEIKAQQAAHQALRAADRQRGNKDSWDCPYK